MNKIRYKGVYRLYRNGVLVSEAPYDLTDAFGSTPAITVEELQLMTSQDIEARAVAMLETLTDRCDNFKVINNVLIESADCADGEDDFMVGQIIDFAGTQWDTEKWIECDGRILAVDDYPELYGVIGTEWTYDDIPSNQFRLPDLRGRVTVGFDENAKTDPRTTGQRDALFGIKQQIENYGRLGNLGGEFQIALGIPELPSHSHVLNIGCGNTRHSDDGTKYAPARNFANTIAELNDPQTWTGVTASTGGGLPHENRPPYAVVHKLIRYKDK
jgi:microcystin-dependent protein